MAARKLVSADPPLRYTIACSWVVKQASKQPTTTLVAALALKDRSRDWLARCVHWDTFYLLLLNEEAHKIV